MVSAMCDASSVESMYYSNHSVQDLQVVWCDIVPSAGKMLLRKKKTTQLLCQSFSHELATKAIAMSSNGIRKQLTTCSNLHLMKTFYFIDGHEGSFFVGGFFSG